MFEHGSTHIDAPAHYSQGRAHIDAVPVEQLMGPGVMIDMTSATDPDYLMTIDDIKVSWVVLVKTLQQSTSCKMVNVKIHKPKQLLAVSPTLL